MNYSPSQRYYETSVSTSSPEQLVVMLYEGAIRQLKQAVMQIESRNLDGKRQSVDRAVAIIQHLQGTLDMRRGGEISVELDRLYSYVLSRIIDGSTRLETAPLHEAAKLLTTLLSSWEEVARQKQEKTVSPPVRMAMREAAVRIALAG